MTQRSVTDNTKIRNIFYSYQKSETEILYIFTKNQKSL